MAHVCPTCGKAFAFASDFARHENAQRRCVAPGTRPRTPCPRGCGKDFLNASHLHRHLKTCSASRPPDADESHPPRRFRDENYGVVPADELLEMLRRPDLFAVHQEFIRRVYFAEQNMNVHGGPFGASYAFFRDDDGRWQAVGVDWLARVVLVDSFSYLDQFASDHAKRFTQADRNRFEHLRINVDESYSVVLDTVRTLREHSDVVAARHPELAEYVEAMSGIEISRRRGACRQPPAPPLDDPRRDL